MRKNKVKEIQLQRSELENKATRFAKSEGLNEQQTLVLINKELENFLINNLRKKDLVVFMGAGNISKMAHEFVNKYIRLNK